MKVRRKATPCFLVPVIIALAFVFSTPVLAQKQGNIWYFGHKAGINFNTSPPQVLVNSQATGNFGHATASDAAGNLQFYFSGGASTFPLANKQIFDRTHQPMPNGSGFIGGNFPSLVVPWPGTRKLYFFTNTLYSVIDMSLHNGLGDVTAIKNIQLNPSRTLFIRDLAAVKHRNNRDYWVIYNTQRYDSAFCAYQITPTGLNTSPVVSAITNLGYHSGNSLKASPDGQTLAANGTTVINLYNFDRATGIVTYRYGIPVAERVIGPMEFSPDGTKLYVIGRHSQGTLASTRTVLRQYDLTAGSGPAVQLSAQIIQKYDSTFYINGSLQVAPDGKIYQIAKDVFNSQVKALNVIHRPNMSGKACRVQLNAFNLEPQNSGTHTAGITFPTFVQSFFHQPKVTMQPGCFGDTTRFELSNHAYADSVRWNFGDPASGSLNNSTSYTPKHFYAAPGTYNVQAIVYYTFTSDTLRQTIFVPTVITKPHLGNDTVLCSGDTLRLNAYQAGASYEWQDSITTDPIYQVTQPGTYWVQVWNGCGISRDTINVRFDQPMVTNFGPDTLLCPGQTLTLEIKATGGQVRWQDGSSQPTYTVTQPGIYSVQLNNSCGQFSDTIRVTYRPFLSSRWLPQDAVLCGDSLRINGTHPDAKNYRWQDGSNDQNYTVKTSGLYWLEITTACQTLRDSIRVTFNPKPAFRFNADTTICSGDASVLKAPPGLNYRWNTGDTTQQISISKGGFYKVNFEVVPGCTFSDSITVKEERCFPTTFLPNIITPNHDTLNDRFEPKT
jgi:hypothetical protein